MPNASTPGASTPDDLQAAVDAGVIDAAQAEKLRALRANNPNVPREATQIGPDGEPALADEERFRFLNGFNDVFLTIGVLLVAGAFLSAAAPAFSLSIVAVAAVTFWLLSELLVRRLRAVLPGMVLAVLFTVFAAAAVVIQYHAQIFADANRDLYSDLVFWRNPTLLFATPALIAATLYYARFRLPFALALIACFGYFVLNWLIAATTGWTLLAFGYGLALFAIALVYDSHDKERRTRLSDCAFWLHLVAAPMIVSPVLAMVKESTNGPSTSGAVLLTVLILGLIALLIDRRAILVSSLFAFTIAVYDILSRGDISQSATGIPSSFVMTLACVGGFVLLLGVFWHPIRKRLLSLFQSTGLARHLPPARQ
ncbi:hypothetical protein DLM45_08185 [Hyphomicrobium methylovorum]|uniref:hypothetical protein n=1 Tax=Hyphomicrobium methylovorum TaxID=84 RepID=UPI0015E68E57|nr:hypothetical protein [Hyphomicrobium methylovorum]MBA2126199.1 hypothetical protein [Hyphomicrobium methylovorum]